MPNQTTARKHIIGIKKKEKIDQVRMLNLEKISNVFKENEDFISSGVLTDQYIGCKKIISNRKF